MRAGYGKILPAKTSTKFLYLEDMYKMQPVWKWGKYIYTHVYGYRYVSVHMERDVGYAYVCLPTCVSLHLYTSLALPSQLSQQRICLQ